MLALVTALTGWSANADNARLQDLFFDACVAPAGALAARCAETPDELGDLSGNSESSLNPSQALTAANAARSTVRWRGREARDRADVFREEEEPAQGDELLALGPFSLLINGRRLGEDQSRRVDLDAERGYRMHVWGARLGFDYRVNRRLVAGALATWETSDLDYDRERPGEAFAPVGRAGSVDQDSLGAAVFANLQLGRSGYLDLSGGYADSDYTILRAAVFQESGREVPQTLVQTRERPDGEETWAAAALGYTTTVAAWSIGPYLGATYSRARVDGYQERDLSDSGLAMTVSSIRSRSLLGQAGLRISRSISRPGYVLLPQASIEYVHELERDGVSVLTGFQLDQNGNRLRLEGDRRDPGYADLGVGLVLLLPNGWMPFVEYQATVGHDDLDRQRFALGLRVEL